MASLQQKIFLTSLLLIGVGLLVLLTLLTPGTQAQGPTLPTPTAQYNDGSGGGSNSNDDNNDSPALAYIELQAQSPPGGAWSLVQWLATDGYWYDVEGWRASLAENGFQKWVVEDKDFNTGPFRWVVMQGQSGSIIGTSDSFTLPDEANETLRITVVLE